MDCQIPAIQKEIDSYNTCHAESYTDLFFYSDNNYTNDEKLVQYSLITTRSDNTIHSTYIDYG